MGIKRACHAYKDKSNPGAYSMRKLHSVALVLAAVPLMMGGCFSSSNSNNAASQQPPPPPPPVGFKALFQPLVGVFPYPNDFFFQGSTDGTLNQTITAFNPFVADVNRIDGFSVLAEITTRFNSIIDPATVVGGVTVHLFEVVIDPVTTATVGFVGPALPGIDYAARVAALNDDPGTVLELKPLRPLNPKSGYLLIVTDGVQDITGDAAVADDVYQGLKDAIAAGVTLPDPQEEGVKQLIGAHLAIAAAAGINADNVVVTASFQTQSTTDSLAAVEAIAMPGVSAINPVSIGTTMDFIGPASPGAADLFVGTVDLPYYLDSADVLFGFWEGGPSPLDPTSTHITRFNPVPIVKSTVTVPMLIAAPNGVAAAVSGCMKPPGGWATVLYLHGVTTDRTTMLGMADALAFACFAVVVIDHPLHGLPPGHPLYAGPLERHFNVDFLDNTTFAFVPDGIVDPSGLHFFNLQSFVTTRDNFRQSSADLITMAKTIPTLNLDGDPMTADFDPARLHFFGWSLGGITGVPMLGVNNDIGAATLFAAGGGLADLGLRESASLTALFNPALIAQGIIPGGSLHYEFIRAAQTVADAGDALNYAAAAAANHPIHAMGIYGTPLDPARPPDLVVPNQSTDRMASVMGLPIITTPGPNFVTHGLVRFTEGHHGTIATPGDDPSRGTPGSPSVFTEAQTELANFMGSDGNVILISDPTVVQ